MEHRLHRPRLARILSFCLNLTVLFSLSLRSIYQETRRGGGRDVVWVCYTVGK